MRAWNSFASHLRRATFASLLAAFSASTLAAAADAPLDAAVAKIETGMRGRIGVFALRGARAVGYRAGERFAYCSTFKWVLAAAALQKVDAGQLALTRVVRFSKKDLTPYSPITTAHAGGSGLSVGDLCAATIEQSDNTAANLLAPLVGGLAGLQSFARTLGDAQMRFDRSEPELNDNTPGDPRDTTTPEAMARSLRAALEGDTLTKASRDRLTAWLRGAKTGAHRLRAGTPAGWTVGDKTGTGDHGAANDVGVLAAAKGDPIYLAVFTDGDQADRATHEAAIAAVAEAVLAALH